MSVLRPKKFATTDKVDNISLMAEVGRAMSNVVRGVVADCVP